MLGQLATDFAPTLLQIGVAGAMLLWFALENSKRMKAVETSVDRMAKANLLQLVSLGHLDSTIRDQAHQLLSEIQAKENSR